MGPDGGRRSCTGQDFVQRMKPDAAGQHSLVPLDRGLFKENLKGHFVF